MKLIVLLLLILLTACRAVSLEEQALRACVADNGWAVGTPILKDGHYVSCEFKAYKEFK